MKTSRQWLQSFFDKELPDAQMLADALTFHAFEIESVKGDVLDVKVTPNRGHDCLSHRGIAKELSAILNIPLTHDSLRGMIELELAADTASVYISIENPELCRRYIAGYIKSVKVGPSPDWLRERLEAIGQKSINNVVDATNYVMFDLGQPLHAFDASKLRNKGKKGESEFGIRVRKAKKGEKMTALDEKEYKLSDSMLVIVDAHTDAAIGIAGVKGGKPAGITEETEDIIIESANFDGVSVRRTASALKLRTDASEHFQQVISPELAIYGMRAAADLIVKVAGGEIVRFTDEYPNLQKPWSVSVSVSKINQILGTTLREQDVADTFTRLDLPFDPPAGGEGEEFLVHVPFERLDLTIPEDLVEEVGRIAGYDKIPSTELSQFPRKPEINKNFYAAERVREEMVAKGHSEVYTSVFADKGERAVLNKVGGERPYLRSNLVDGLTEALQKNITNKDLLGVKEVKLFEIGTVWQKDEEKTVFATIGEKEKGKENALKPAGGATDYEDLPLSTTERYQPFSKYPYIVRDVALWVPSDTGSDAVLALIREHAGELLVRVELFDRFEKDGKTSFAFRLVFQSFDRTLTDEDANQRMESVYSALKSKGFEVR